MRRISLLVAVIIGAALSHPADAAAQTDVIRGQITGPDKAPVPSATITVTSISSNVTRAARTDKNGRFSVAFPGNDGDYFVSVAAMGFAAKRFEVKRNADEEILIADARLQTVAQQLDAMKIHAQRGTVRRSDGTPDISGSERRVDQNALTADQLGDIAAMAASLPGVQLIPNADGTFGISTLGLTADQSITTLNGSSFGGSTLPADAGVASSFVASQYDVSIGGFSGGAFQLMTLPGSNYILRQSLATLSTPQVQWTDRAAQALGQQYTNVVVNERVAGPIQFDKSFYNVAFSFTRNQRDLQTLLNTSDLGLVTAGLAPDSARRFQSLVGGMRIPLSAGAPSDRFTNRANFLGSFDFNPPTSTTGQAYNLTVNASAGRTDPLGISTTQLPSYGGASSNWSGFVSARNSGYYGIFLSQTTLSLNAADTRNSPFVQLPSGSVRVNSLLPDGSSGISVLGFGGNQGLSSKQSSLSGQFRNVLSWYSEDNKHTLKLTSELQRQTNAQDLTNNALGSFTYNSLADLGADRPASFTRQLAAHRRSENQDIGALALGDSYRPSDDLQLVYGVRVDGNHFDTAPTDNPLVARDFGISNTSVPSRAYVSPRLGFSWTYGDAPQVAGFFGAARTPRAVLRGGIGMFQNVPQATTLGGPLDNTGLASAAQQLTCVGGAVPTPDWAAYLTNPGMVPTACADGSMGTVFSNSAPNVTLFDPRYQAPRRWSSNLNWSGLTIDNRFRTTVDVTEALNVNQAGITDLNFVPVQRFNLAGEGGRPVYARVSSIVPSTGAIALGDARVTSDFAHVTELRSDLRSQTSQVSVSLQPYLYSSAYSWGLTYTYMNAREQYHGFTSTGGNPLDMAWSRSQFDSRHQVVYNLSYNAFDWVRLQWSGQFRSGLPYTPVVASDINGDGYPNDRAFIFDPTHTADSVLANGMRTLLSDGSRTARECLDAQLGRIATRNSCQGPWTHTAVLNISFNPIKVRMPQRASLVFQLSNPLGAADLLAHGEDHLRGWGQSASPSPQLLFVRGFDPATQQYRYEVNQRFGATSIAQSAFRTPVTLTAMIRLDEGPTRERQVLTQMLDRGRRHDGTKAPESILRAMYGNGGVINPMSVLLAQADSIQLTESQADSIAFLNRMYVVRLDSIWLPVTKYLASLPDSYDESDAYRRYQVAREASVDALAEIAPVIREMLTPAQLRRLPAFVTQYLDTRFLASVRSGTSGFGMAGFGPGGGPGGMGGPGQQVMIMKAP